MKKEDYFKTFEVNGVKIDVGLDDYGQCYYIEWEENGEKKSTGLGTYNFYYLDAIYHMFDPVYRELNKKEMFGEDMTPEEIKKLEEYRALFRKEYGDD